MLKIYEAPEIYLLELFSKEDILTESTNPPESGSESESGNVNNDSYGANDGGGL